MKKLLCYAMLLALFACSRAELSEMTAEEELSLNEALTNPICNAKVAFRPNLNIKGLVLAKSDAYQMAPQDIIFRVLKDNDTFILESIISEGDYDTLKIHGPGSTPNNPLYMTYAAELKEKHCRHTYDIYINFKQIGPLYRNVVVESNNPRYGKVTGGGKYIIGEEHTITAAITDDSPVGFSHWTKNGEVVENAGMEYKFALTDDDYNAGDTTSIRYMAHFSMNAVARVVFEYTQGGYVTGWQDLGLYLPVGRTFTLTAQPEVGYKFSHWLKSTYETGPVIVGTESTYSGIIENTEGTTYTGVFESLSQKTSVTFNNYVDDSDYSSNTYLTYTDPSGNQQTLRPTSLTSFFDIKKDTPVILYVDIRKEGAYIPCFISTSDENIPTIDLSAENKIITVQEIPIKGDMEDMATITLQVGE